MMPFSWQSRTAAECGLSRVSAASGKMGNPPEESPGKRDALIGNCRKSRQIGLMIAKRFFLM
jgi:hypothetical protein